MARRRMPQWARYQVLRELWQEARLAWELLKDPRVPMWTKAVVPGTWLAYLLSPVDIFPDVFPILGQMDDLMLLLLAIRMFIALSPAHVVAEAEARLRGRTVRGQEVVDGEYRVID